ncbi:metallophosphoesterase [Geobacter sp. SVR]|uniref:metallophosphoesterase family protein n=1 Tax=Geobacter sp. SVR TaxID=2495594 RepID=UPI00143EFE6B|nr:metallophosphoesterase [Geobacter sp. SVR]BCS54087.1 hypothetical protein GSVR_23950 [Geobacter sp. SVR]GCF87570.1 hypothetical protein GSbR_41700 [Geobacter sp. SVR]
MSKQSWIVSGDIHLRIKPDLPLEWQLNRYRLLWQTYINLCLEHDAMLILSGDIFDNHKINTREMQLFLELCTLVSRAGIDIWVIDGNHDYSDPNNTTLEHFRSFFDSLNSKSFNTPCGAVRYVNHTTVQFRDCEFAFVGHSRIRDCSLVPSKDRTTVLVSHFRPDVNEYIKEEIDVAAFTDGYDLVLASDIHTDLTIGGRIFFTNSPLNNHFEPDPTCGCLLVTCTNGSLSTTRIPLDLPNLVQVTVDAADYKEIVADYHFYRVEVTGTPEELRKISSSNTHVTLLKVPEVVETYTEVKDDTVGIITSLEDSLIGYMQELGYDQGKIQQMMEVYHGT